MARYVRAALFSLAAISCGHSASAPSSTLDLTGTWSGIAGETGSGTALRVTWTATQDGANVSGPATVVKPAIDVAATGPMNGTLTGTTLSLTYSVSAGSVPVFLSCMATGTGSASATNTAITGMLSLTFTNCLGTGLQSPASHQLSLTRQ